MANKLYNIPDDYDWSVFQNHLKELMDSYGFNMSGLADATKLNVTSISRYLKGRVPDLIAVWRIADYFNVTIDWIIGRVPSKFENIPEEQREILRKYSLASPEDKKIVKLFLSKYND